MMRNWGLKLKCVFFTLRTSILMYKNAIIVSEEAPIIPQLLRNSNFAYLASFILTSWQLQSTIKKKIKKIKKLLSTAAICVIVVVIPVFRW